MSSVITIGNFDGVHLGHQALVAHARAVAEPGQTVAVNDDEPLDLMLLRPGEFSLHHTFVLHNSMPNRSADRRIGLGISYIPADCRCTASVVCSTEPSRASIR